MRVVHKGQVRAVMGGSVEAKGSMIAHGDCRAPAKLELEVGRCLAVMRAATCGILQAASLWDWLLFAGLRTMHGWLPICPMCCELDACREVHCPR